MSLIQNNLQRQGWDLGTVRCVTRSGSSVREAYIYHGRLAIVKAHPAGGWSIVHPEIGMRIEVGGRLMTDEAVAMRIVEKIDALVPDWAAWFSPVWFPTPDVAAAIEKAHMDEEPFGFLPVRVATL